MSFGKRPVQEAEIIDDDEASSSLMRWLPPFVVMAVLGGFVALAWAAYHAGVQSGNDADLPVIEADKTPMKEKPVDPGGMQFPNQDKTVFDTFAANSEQPPKVERVLPPPEEPIQTQTDTSGTTTWVNDKLKPAPTEQVIGDDKPKEAAPTPTSAPVAEPVKETPTPVPTPTPEVRKEPEKAPPAPVKAVAGNAGIKVQLGAYRSDKEARDAWAKMQKKIAALSGHAPLVVKADLGAKGIYYRLRVGGFTDAATAKAFCGKLSAAGQACILSAAK